MYSSGPYRQGSLAPRPDILQTVSVINAIVFFVAIGVAMTYDVVVAEALAGVGHWRTPDRNLVIVDHSGDPQWEQATREAVDVWNQAGAEVRLTWTRGQGPCRADGNWIHVCTTPRHVLRRLGIPRLEGLALPEPGEGDHYGSAVVRVCADCRLSRERQAVVVIHELGHVLGLDHSRDVESVMHPAGGLGRPTDRDISDVRALYLHEDTT